MHVYRPSNASYKRQTLQDDEPLLGSNRLPVGHSANELKNDKDTDQKSFLSSKIAGIVTAGVVVVVGLFCFTVRSFPSGLIRIEGPGEFRMEVQLGALPAPVQPSPSDRK